MHARRMLTACYLFNEDLNRVVDLEVIKTRTNVPSETSRTREDFRALLLERDDYCVWSGISYGAGMHIIPFKQGSDVRSIIIYLEYVSSSPFLWLIFQWLRLIIENRPKYGERLASLRSINDIRNGVFANNSILQGFDARSAVILKVCHLFTCWSCLISMSPPIILSDSKPYSSNRRCSSTPWRPITFTRGQLSG
jgi:hypothetical protein